MSGGNGNFIELSPDLAFLLVDESTASRDQLAEFLRRLGYRRIFHAHDAFSGFNVMKREKIGFVIAEKLLPHISGLEFLREIRENPQFHRMPFTLVAMEIDKADTVLAAEYNVDAVLSKPFAIKEVSKRISMSMANFLGANNIERTYDYARERYLSGEHKESLDVYRKLIHTFPNSARARVGAGRCLRALKNYDVAIRLLLEAIDTNRTHIHAQHELAVTYLEMGKDQEALEAFNRAIAISPKNPIRYEMVASILIKAERFAEATEFLQKAINLGLTYPILYEQLGKSLFSQHRRDKALQYYLQALRGDPTNISFLNSIAICMKEMGRLDEALKYYNAAIKQSPSDHRVLFNKALCLIQMKDYERAKSVLARILQINPNYDKAVSKLAAVEQMIKLAAEEKRNPNAAAANKNAGPAAA